MRAQDGPFKPYGIFGQFVKVLIVFIQIYSLMGHQLCFTETQLNGNVEMLFPAGILERYIYF